MSSGDMTSLPGALKNSHVFSYRDQVGFLENTEIIILSRIHTYRKMLKCCEYEAEVVIRIDNHCYDMPNEHATGFSCLPITPFAKNKDTF